MMENYPELMKTRFRGSDYDIRKASFLSFIKSPVRTYKESPTVKDYVEITEEELERMSFGENLEYKGDNSAPDVFDITTQNGKVTRIPEKADRITVMDIEDAVRKPESGLKLEFLTEKGDDRIEHLINSTWQKGIFINIPNGFNGEIKIHNVSSAESSYAYKAVIMCGEDSNVRITDIYGSTGSGSGVQGKNVYIFLAMRSKVQYDYLQDKNNEVTDLTFVKSFLAEYSEFSIYHVNHGAGKVVFSNESIQRGDSSDFRTYGINFSGGDQKMDIRDSSFQLGIATSADIHVKGVVLGRSSTMHRGNIDIEERSIKSTGYYDSKILLMSRDGFANTKPALLIKNNNTRSKHASAISSVDDDQIFYMQSRGIPKNLAKNLITGGFVGSTVEKSGDSILMERVEKYSEGIALYD